MRDSLKTPYFLLFILLIGCFLFYFLPATELDWLKDFSLDMAAEIVGIFLVVFSIDRVIAIDQEKERRKFEKVAFLQLRRPLLRHFYLLFNMFKAAVQEKPDKNYEAASSLFDETYFSQIAFLDFSQSAPAIASIDATWSDYLLRECTQFQDSLNRTMEKYSLFLQSDIVDLMEEIINSPFIWLVIQAPLIRQIGNKNGLSKSYNLLAREEIRELLRDYTVLVSKLLDFYNESVPEEKKIKITKDLWADDVPPKIGSARL